MLDLFDVKRFYSLVELAKSNVCLESAQIYLLFPVIVVTLIIILLRNVGYIFLVRLLYGNLLEQS